MVFQDRTDAGRRLAEMVRAQALTDPLVLALPRGGVPVGVEVARAVAADFDVFVARKVGAPGRAELGVGAVAETRDAEAPDGSGEPTVWSTMACCAAWGWSPPMSRRPSPQRRKSFGGEYGSTGAGELPSRSPVER